MSEKKLNVVVWNEFRHERFEEACRNIYPDGIHGLIKSFLEADDASLNVRLAALDDPDQGLPDEVLNETDVLLWWGHMAHHEVDDGLVELEDGDQLVLGKGNPAFTFSLREG